MINMQPCKDCERRSPGCQGFKCKDWALMYSQKQVIEKKRKAEQDYHRYRVEKNLEWKKYLKTKSKPPLWNLC